MTQHHVHPILDPAMAGFDRAVRATRPVPSPLRSDLKVETHWAPNQAGDGNTSPADGAHPERPRFVAGNQGWQVEMDGLTVTLSVSVVIPTLNEGLNLPAVLSQMPRGVNEVIVVDGGSRDGTEETLRDLFPQVRLIHQELRGKGTALRTGFEAATGDIIVMMDADGSMSPLEIGSMISALVAGADIVKGSRHLAEGDSEDFTALRRVGNIGLTWAFNVLYGSHITDMSYGFVAFWRRHLPTIEPRCTGFEVDTYMKARAVRSGLRVVEVPSHEGRRIYGDSKLHPIRDGFRLLNTIVRERFRAGPPPGTR